MNVEPGRPRGTVQTTGDAGAIDDSVAEFRAVVSDGKRRGIKLERVFWQAVKSIAKTRGETIGGLIDRIAVDYAHLSNLTSAIRVACMRDYVERHQALSQVVSPQAIDAILAASPSAAFTLGPNKKIVAFNTGFQTLVRRQFPALGSEPSKVDLRLSLDVGVDELIARLSRNGNMPIATGFALGLTERRYRGQINVVRMPSSEADLLLAFVVG